MPFLTSLNAVAVLPVSVMFLQGLQETIDYLACSGLQKEKIGPLRCGASWKYVFGSENNNIEEIALQHFNIHSTKICAVEKFLPWDQRKTIKTLLTKFYKDWGTWKYVRHFRLKSQFPLSPSLYLWISRAWRQRKFFYSTLTQRT